MEEKKTERQQELDALLNECNDFIRKFYGNRELKEEDTEMFLLSELVIRMLFVIGAHSKVTSVFRLFTLFVGRFLTYASNAKRNIQNQYIDIAFSAYGDKGNSESMCKFAEGKKAYETDSKEGYCFRADNKDDV